MHAGCAPACQQSVWALGRAWPSVCTPQPAAVGPPRAAGRLHMAPAPPTAATAAAVAAATCHASTVSNGTGTATEVGQQAMIALLASCYKTCVPGGDAG